jgi:hypothetical protein
MGSFLQIENYLVILLGTSTIELDPTTLNTTRCMALSKAPTLSEFKEMVYPER